MLDNILYVLYGLHILGEAANLERLSYPISQEGGVDKQVKGMPCFRAGFGSKISKHSSLY